MSIRLKIFSPYFSYWIVSTNNVSTTILALLRKMMISIENFDGNNVTPCYKNITPIFFLLDTGDLKQSKMECLRYIIDKNTFFLLEELKSFFLSLIQLSPLRSIDIKHTWRTKYYAARGGGVLTSLNWENPSKKVYSKFCYDRDDDDSKLFILQGESCFS